MPTASCHCGAIHLHLACAPTEVTDCTCSICRRYGVLWAYYAPTQVTITPPDAPTDIYMWDDRTIRFHRCKTCGNLTHWSAVDPARNRMGINARLLPLETLAQVRIRHLDGAVTEQYLD